MTAVSASEDEAAESGVSGEDGVHAAGRPRLLLRCSGSDAAFLFRGNDQNKCLIHIFTPTVFLNYRVLRRFFCFFSRIITE